MGVGWHCVTRGGELRRRPWPLKLYMCITNLNPYTCSVLLDSPFFSLSYASTPEGHQGLYPGEVMDPWRWCWLWITYFYDVVYVNVSVYICVLSINYTHSGSTGYTEHSTIADILWWIDSGQLRPAVGSAVLRPDGVVILTLYLLLCFYLYVYIYLFICGSCPPLRGDFRGGAGVRFTNWRAHQDQPLMGRCSTEFWCSPSLLLVLGCEPKEVAETTGGRQWSPDGRCPRRSCALWNRGARHPPVTHPVTSACAPRRERSAWALRTSGLPPDFSFICFTPPPPWPRIVERNTWLDFSNPCLLLMVPARALLVNGWSVRSW